MRWASFILFLLAAYTSFGAATLTVGIEGRMKVSLPLAGLKARPPQRQEAIALRVAEAKAQGETTLYDFRYIGLVPGRHDLRHYLLRPDGMPAEDLPPLEVEVRGLLPPNRQGMLIAIPKGEAPAVGGYIWIEAGAILIWLVVAVAIFRRRRTGSAIPEVPLPVQLTLPERLRVLVQQAADGNLGVAGKAELERGIIGHWSEELNFGAMPLSEVLVRLRAHPQAGALLGALEDWLHRRPDSKPIDLEPLLRAYALMRDEPQQAEIS